MTADPWALLREALSWMREMADRRGPCRDCTECDQRDAIIKKADAALAERQDSAKDVVEWRMTNSPIGTTHAYLDGVDLRVRWDGQDAAWDATRYGRCATEAEAKSAAIAAAKGMR